MYFIFTGYAYPYFAPMAEAVKQAASHYPDMAVKIVNANNSASDEIADINEAVAAGAKGIILNTIQGVRHRDCREGDQGRRAHRHRRSRRQHPSARVAFIGDNDETLGREETQYGVDTLAKLNVPKPWRVIVLQARSEPASRSAVLRARWTCYSR